MIDLAITAGTLALFDLVFDQNGLSLYKAFFNRFTQNAVYDKGKMLRSSFHRIVEHNCKVINTLCRFDLGDADIFALQHTVVGISGSTVFIGGSDNDIVNNSLLMKIAHTVVSYICAFFQMKGEKNNEK